VLVTGENKAGIMLSVLTQSGEIKYPIQGVHAADDLVWMLDDSAATELLKHGIPLNLSKLP
jgi:6-phosphogluconolactonase/glucosamine-6-phosphate isomerase/deaminase